MVIVVSPLEVIRKQQVDRLNSIGIKSASLDNFNLDTENRELQEGIEILFGSAEQWLSNEWKLVIKNGMLGTVEFLVVDEVHTMETWYVFKTFKIIYILHTQTVPPFVLCCIL